MTDVRKLTSEASNKTADKIREGARGAVDGMESMAQQGVDGVRRMTAQVSDAFGFSGERGEELSQRASKNVESITDTGTVLMRGLEELSREWINLSQERLQRNIQAMSKLANCRTVQDFFTVQTEVVRDHMEQAIDGSR